jgi:hypothetical protein
MALLGIKERKKWKEKWKSIVQCSTLVVLEARGGVGVDNPVNQSLKELRFWQQTQH